MRVHKVMSGRMDRAVKKQVQNAFISLAVSMSNSYSETCFCTSKGDLILQMEVIFL